MPVTWTERADGAEACYDAVLDATDWDATASQFADVLARACDVIQARLKPTTWNRLYVEKWPSSGRVILYPHKRGRSRSQRVMSVAAESAFVLREYDALPSATDSPDDFESHLLALMGEVDGAIIAAFNDPRVVAAITRFREATDVTIWEQEEADEDTLTQFFLPY